MIDILSAALFAFGESLKKLPDYEQKRREEYDELVYKFTREIESDDPDSRIIYDLHSQLMCFFKGNKAP